MLKSYLKNKAFIIIESHLAQFLMKNIETRKCLYNLNIKNQVRKSSHTKFCLLFFCVLNSGYYSKFYLHFTLKILCTYLRNI